MGNFPLSTWSARELGDSILPVRGVARFLIVLLVVAALPLRGYASVAAGLCDAHHGGPPAGQAAAHGHEPGDYADTGKTEFSDFATACSLCATCSVGASLAPDMMHVVGIVTAGTIPIPFSATPMSGCVPGTLDRPPLPL